MPVLLAAGLGGGLAGSVAGLASLASYPVLLALGYPAVTANVTNTVAMVFSSVGSVSGSRPELAGQAARLRPLAVAAVAGGLLGGGLLLLTPGAAFVRLVPWLIGLASVGILVRSGTGADEVAPAPARWVRIGLPALILLVGVYGGYFGAAAGVLMLAALLAATGEPIARATAAKNVLLGLANGVAAVTFALDGPVRWWAVLPLAAGFFAGGRLGPVIVRRTPARSLRVVIAVAGVGLAVYLGIEAYR